MCARNAATVPFVRLFEPIVEMSLDEEFLKLLVLIAVLLFGLIYFVTKDDERTEQAYKDVIGKKD